MVGLSARGHSFVLWPGAVRRKWAAFPDPLSVENSLTYPNYLRGLNGANARKASIDQRQEVYQAIRPSAQNHNGNPSAG